MARAPGDPSRRPRVTPIDPLEAASPARWRTRLDGLLDLCSAPTCIGCHSAPPAATTASLPHPTEPDAPDSKGPTPHPARLTALFCAPCEAALGLEPCAPPGRRVGRVPWPVFAPLRYHGAGESWVRRIKYPRPGLAGLDAEAHGLMRALARGVAAELVSPVDAVVPVPLHRSAYLRREQNPALRFARSLARAWGAPVWPGALTKRHATRPQKGLGVAARRANVRDAFVVPHHQEDRLRRANRVVLVDDVVTTGATVEACVRALRAGGLGCPSGGRGGGEGREGRGDREGGEGGKGRGAGVVVCLARTPDEAEML